MKKRLLTARKKTLQEFDVAHKDDTNEQSEMRLQQSIYRANRSWPIGHVSRDGVNYAWGNLLGPAAPANANFLEDDELRAGIARYVARARACALSQVDASVPQAVRRFCNANIQERRLRSNLLSSQPMCCNLFVILMIEPGFGNLIRLLKAHFQFVRVDRVELRLEYSPGRQQLEFLGDGTAFDAFLVVEADGRRGFVAIETKYHEKPDMKRLGQGKDRSRAEEARRRAHYVAVMQKCGAFDTKSRAFLDAAGGQAVTQTLRDHLLALTMLSPWRPSAESFDFGHFLVLYPDRNNLVKQDASVFASNLSCRQETFRHMSLESFLAPADIESSSRLRAFWTRYLDFKAVDAMLGTP